MNATKASPVQGATTTSSVVGTLPNLPSKSMWDLLNLDSGAGIMFCDTSGRVLYVNERFAKYINQASAAVVNGRLLFDIYPDVAAKERLEVIRRCARDRKVLVAESVWNGIAFQTILRPMGMLGGDPNTVIAIARLQPKRDADDVPVEYERVPLRSNNLGPLSTLTMRELELLALIGEGLSTQDIAKRISRSIKTVEAHRASLGKKLGVASRVALAKIASESNLHFDMLQTRQVLRGRIARNGTPSGN